MNPANVSQLHRRQLQASNTSLIDDQDCLLPVYSKPATILANSATMSLCSDADSAQSALSVTPPLTSSHDQTHGNHLDVTFVGYGTIGGRSRSLGGSSSSLNTPRRNSCGVNNNQQQQKQYLSVKAGDSNIRNSTASLNRPQDSSVQSSMRSVSFASDVAPVVTSAPQPAMEPRPRSGSWSGVNESEDELEQLDETVILSHHLTSSVTYGAVNTRDDELAANLASGTTNTAPTQQQQQHGIEVKAMKMRRRLKFFFMNPIEKWNARNRFPWKLLLQIIKIVVVTAQLWLFANQRYTHVAYLWDTRVSFSHMFLEGWESTREVNAYPPSDGPLAVYTQQEFYDYLDYAITSYTNLTTMSIGSYEYHDSNESTDGILPSVLCCEHYTTGYTSRRDECLQIPWSAVNMTSRDMWSTKDYLDSSNFTILFDKLTSCRYVFKVKAVKLRTPPETTVPDCYNLTSSIMFDNDDRDGQMLVALNIQATVLSCHSEDNSWSTPESTSLNVVTIILCLMSLGMCLRSLYRAQLLRYSCEQFFRLYHHRRLGFGDKMEFCNFWYVIICINDVLIFIGTLLKLGLESRLIGDTTLQNYEGYLDTWNVCSLFLGVGNLLVWFGCLRYLGFFQTYNVLILTLKKCFPNVLRYSICIAMLFSGYCFCGWLVLSPYHIKFRSLSITMECLFSLINGDDMFATFSSTSAKDPVIWWFSRLYLYSFISLFIYVILSLFLAIIMDAYDTIKNYYTEGFPLSPLHQFVHECREDSTSRVFHEEGDRTIHDMVNSLCCCCLSTRSSTEDERQPLVSREEL